MADKSINEVIIPAPTYDQEYWTDIVFQWADSTFKIVDSQGNSREAGTVLRIRNKIEFLHHLTDNQLLQLQNTVSQAVDYELQKRKSNK